MDFVTVEGRALLPVLKLAGDVVARGATIPILTCVRLSLDGAVLRVEATDLDMVIRADVEISDGAGAWSVCLPAAVLAGIARVAGPMPVRIEPGDKAIVTLGNGEAVYTLDQLPAGDFPDLLTETGGVIEHFGNGSLTDLMGRVSAFISTEETRYYLNGVAWQAGAFGCRFVATDGHRMGICRYDSEPLPDSTRIVPFKAVAILARHFAGRDVTVSEAGPGSNAPALRFSAGNLDFRTKLIDGKYPEIERVLPDGTGATIAFKRAEVHAALARLMAAGRPNYGLGIKLSGQNGHCAIERTLDCGQARVATSTAWPAEAPPFGVSALYFADMMYACDGDPSLVVKSASDPILIRDIDPTMTRVLMPRRI